MAATTAAVVAAAATAAAAAKSVADKPGSGGKKPKSPNFAKEYKEGIKAQAEMMPLMLNTELAAAQQFDPAMMDHRLAMADRSARGTASQALEIGGEFGPKFIEQNKALLEAADPTGRALREAMGQSVLKELALGRNRSQDEINLDLQAIRGAQAARGNMLGDANILNEALALSRGNEERFQRRLQNSAAFLGMPSERAMLEGIQTGYNPMPDQPSYRLFNPAVGPQAANFAQGNFATQSGIYATQMNQPNPWLQGLGAVAGFAGRMFAPNPVPSATQTPALLDAGQGYKSPNPFIA
jgi:hypothetical protein